MILLLQLDSDQAFRDEVSAYFSRLDGFAYQDFACAEGLEQVLSRDKPQVILLAMDCPPHGGMEVLQQIRKELPAEETKVVIVSPKPPGERALSRAAQLGADYVLMRPVDLVVLEKRIRQLLKPAAAAASGELAFQQVQEICTSYFERLGIPPHYKGYRYLMVGIWLAMQHPEWLNAVTRHLYPAIGQSCGVSGAQVERAMRYALEAAWEKGNVEELYQLFPYVAENKGKPTNSEFISKMVHLVGLAAQRRG
ncbi:MAG: response regulator [Firmicutes bacterium]|nr:response regulator [Bacillota bacterium]